MATPRMRFAVDVKPRKALLAASVVLASPLRVLAWDVEHDLVAQLAAESLPAEVRATFSGDDALAIVRYSHIPDQDESREPPRFRTLEELAAIVGSADIAEMQAAGATSARFFHDDAGIVTLFHLLAKAFRAGETAKAAFYFGTLTHTLGDRSSLNHTPLLHWAYSGLVPRVESPERGRFGRPVTFSPQGPVTARVRTLLARRAPRLLADDVPEAAICALEAQAVLSARAAELEATIAWGDEKSAQKALAQLVAEQVGAMVDAGWTAWKLRDKACPVVAATLAAAATRFEKAVRACDPAKEAVYCGVFDESLNPADPKATVGIVCENYRGVESTLSFGGKAIAGAAARTLRDAGYAVKGLNLWKVESLPDPKEMALMIVALKDLKPDERSTIPDGFLKAIAQYRAAGGRILAIGGTDSGGITDFRPSMNPLPDAAIPVAAAWGEKNGELWRHRGVVCTKSLARTAGFPHPFMRNPSVGAYTKGVCRFEVKGGHGLSPLAWVYDNAPGGGRRVVAARSVCVAWVPEYFFTPFVLSSDSAVNWAELRLDSFGSSFLLDVVEDLLCGDKTADVNQ